MPDSLYPSSSRALSDTRKQLAPETHNAFQAFSQKVFADGALPAKMKQLIAVAVAMSRNAPTASAATQRPPCGKARQERNSWKRSGWQPRCALAVPMRTRFSQSKRWKRSPQRANEVDDIIRFNRVSE